LTNQIAPGAEFLRETLEAAMNCRSTGSFYPLNAGFAALTKTAIAAD
jgi:hypothetical protein